MLRNFAINLIRNVGNSNRRSFSQTSLYFTKKDEKEKQVETIEEKEAAKPKDTKKVAEKAAEKEKKVEIPNYVCTDKDGDIFLIGINRPEVRNAINNATALQICEAFMKFEDDLESKVAVLYGVGGSFCSGYDLKELSSEDGNVSTDLLMQTEGCVGPTRRHIKKPVICSIDGYCVANGLELAMMCDLRVMDECATLGFFNRKFGVPILDAGTARLPAMIGFSRALDLILTGRSVDANEALQMGLINRIVATGTSLGQAVKLACTIAKFPQASLNHDRNSVYSAVYDSPNFNQSVQNEIMYTSKEVIDDMTAGIRLYNETAKTNEKPSSMSKDKSMADWEKEEICIENSVKLEEEPQLKQGKNLTKPKGKCPTCGTDLLKLENPCDSLEDLKAACEAEAQKIEKIETPISPYICARENDEYFEKLKEACSKRKIRKNIKIPVNPFQLTKKQEDKKPENDKKPKSDLTDIKKIEVKKPEDEKKDPKN